MTVVQVVDVNVSVPAPVNVTVGSVQLAGGGGTGAVDSVNGKTGVVVLDASDVGADPSGAAAAAVAGIPADGAAGTASLRTLGTSATQAAAGNDTRLSDARTPTAHAASHASAGSDPVTLSASQVTSGQFAVARLASGTPDGTKFIRDDGTLATPAGGGGGGAGLAFGVITGSGLWSPLVHQVSPTPNDSVIFGEVAGAGVVRPFAFLANETLTSLLLEVTSAVANTSARLAIVADNGLTPVGGSVLYDSGSIDASTSGFHTVTLSQAITAGTLYWIAVVQQGSATGLRVRSVTPTTAMPSSNAALTQYSGASYTFSGVTGAFPTTFPAVGSSVSAASGSTVFPHVLAKVA